MINKNDKVLINGIKLPVIGYGTAELGNENETIAAVIEAVRSGYQLIDTASVYNNEKAVGKAIKEVEKEGFKREQLIISSKLGNDDQGYYTTIEAFNNTLNNLQVDYLDLYLIHWPIPKDKTDTYKDLNIETWKAMEELYHKNLVRAIGVCNFLQRHLDNIIINTEIMPMINQLEIHPRYQQTELLSYCKDKNIIIEGWGPFQHGKIFEIDMLKKMADKYHKSIAQLCIRWSIQKGVIPLPKASSKKRMLENLDINDFFITEQDMDIIGRLNSQDGHEDFWNYKRQLLY